MIVETRAGVRVMVEGRVALLSALEYIAGREVLHYNWEIEPEGHLVAQLETLAVNNDQKADSRLGLFCTFFVFQNMVCELLT